MSTKFLRSVRPPLFGWAVAIPGTAGACLSGYLALLSAAALARRCFAAASQEASGEPSATFIVLIPAHNEQLLIERCIASLLNQDYPRDLYRIVVVADNCTDDTSARATSAGAEALDRDEPTATGKGRALRWAMDMLLPQPDPPDGYVIIDADSIADQRFLMELARTLTRGTSVIQADYLALQEDHDARANLRAAAFLLFHRVRFSGRAALGLPCGLVGNGMLLTRDLVETHPWDAFTGAEDLEYSIDLRLAGIRPAFAPSARVWGPVASAGRGARTQRLRWEGGRWHVIRTRLPKLTNAMIHERRWSLWDAVLDLSVPPLGLLSSGAATGLGVALALRTFRLVPAWATVPWGVAVAALPVHVFLGLLAGDAPASYYRALLAAPQLVAAETLTRLRLLRGVSPTAWERTARPGE